ncbi:MAG: hypothetical protein R3Y46_01215 [Opitutales bacterium]
MLIAFSLLGGAFSLLFNGLNLEKNKQEIREGTSSFFFAILGGYGNVISDFIWLRAYIYWDRQDLDNCIANMDLALAINPHSKSLWTYAYTTLAYDSPHWIAEERGLQNMKQIGRIQGKKALKYIERALEYFPEDRSFLMDKANIYIHKLDDIKSAIAIYKDICDKDESLVFPMRNYANLLYRDGQIKASKKVLQKIITQLPPNTPTHKEISQELEALELK